MSDPNEATFRDLESIRDALRVFNSEREWGQFHSHRNLVLALAGEVGELAATVQWIPDSEIEVALTSPKLRRNFEDELADCLAYVVQIADRADVDLSAAFERKLRLNGDKYPIERSRGNAVKYSDFED
ncbi:nucleotide pyrophosphohydrolase [Leucobacter viscericola]|uniref:Nucleotide pyrophosphohydrolase n=1 Tax=Leucobacter viscericola TaxID=2714935 RepID=A0A6G7XH96_9MICO|nr:nucleotide pyrophosphohydrolase [Leucobacter viscericola]QIK63757.1 nucleotide pyrophosphohydrolase [Leucobacter viscericola]